MANDIEDTPLGSPATAEPTTRSTGAAVLPGSTTDLTRLFLALLVVIGIIYGLRMFLKRTAAFQSVVKGGKGVRLIGRTVLSPKQSILTLQIGKRLIVVGDSGGAMSALCTIEDPDEIAALIGEASRSDSSDRAGAFAGLFQKAGSVFKDPNREPVFEEKPAIVEPDGEPSPDMAGLLATVQRMKRQLGQN